MRTKKRIVSFAALAAAGCLSLSVAAVGLGSLLKTAAAEPAPAAETAAAVYLMPGSYYAEGEKVWNTVEGLTALSATDRDALHLEGNVYKAGGEGSTLPEAKTTRENVTFNGWWYIKDAVVTYTEVVPEVKATTYLYADFRADLSQHRDPVEPSGKNNDVESYMEIYRSATGKTEKVVLFVSGTDVPNAVGSSTYGGPVQFYNEWFTVSPGDVITIYVSGVYGALTSGAQKAPQLRNGKQETQLESNAGVNYTTSWLQSNGTDKQSFRCCADATHPYRIYIKFYDNGGTMTIYMEPQDK